MKYLARFFSYFLHPVLMPLIGVVIIFNSGIYQSDIPFEIKKYTYLIVALFSIIIPISLLSVLAYWNLVQNIELTERKERFFPMIFSFVSVFILHIIMRKTIPIKLLNAFTLAMTVVLLLYLITNFKLKTSLHLLGLGGITGLLAVLTILFRADVFFWLSLAILFAGIAGTSRLFLKAHSLGEVIFGYLIGFSGVYCTIYFTV